MNCLARRARTLLPSLVLLAAPVVAQTTHFGVEPNQTKLDATLLTEIAPGDLIVPGAEPPFWAAPNIVVLRPTAQPAGIYRHELQPSSQGAGQMTVLGRDATVDFIYPLSTGDVQRAGSSSSGSFFLSWYGFGKSEEVVVNLATSNSSRSNGISYEHTLSPVQEIDLGSISTTLIDIRVDGGSSGLGEFDYQFFDADFNALPYAGRHQAPLHNAGALTTSLPPGEYHIAVSDRLLATHLAPGPSDPSASTVVLDYAGSICGSSPDHGMPVRITILDRANSLTILQQLTANKTQPFEVLWFKLTVGAGQSVAAFCPGDGIAALCPCGVPSPLNSGMGCVNSTGRGATVVVARPYMFSINNPVGTWRITLEDLPASTLALGFVSLGAAAPGGVGGGLLCLAHGAVRVGPLFADINGSAAMEVADFPARGLPIGQTVYLQAAYRDIASAPGCQLNFTSGYSFVID